MCAPFRRFALARPPARFLFALFFSSSISLPSGSYIPSLPLSLSSLPFLSGVGKVYARKLGDTLRQKGEKEGAAAATRRRDREDGRVPHPPPPPPLNLLSRVSHARDIGNIGLELLIANAAHVNLLTVQYVWIRMRITLRVS